MRKTPYVLLTLVLLPIVMLSFLAGRHYSNFRGGAATGQRRVLYYVDPMHPAYKSDKPGIAPDCGMQLEAVYADGEKASGSGENASLPTGTVSIDAQQQQLIGLRTATVEKSSGTRTVGLLGKVAADEERSYRLTAGTDGYVEQTFANPTGSLVKKDQRLATFRSPDFIAFEQAYLTALVQAPQFKSEVINESDWRNQTAKIAYGRLRALGMSEAQLKQISTTHAVEESIDIVSPVDGFVVTRSVSAGQRMEKGAEFYRISDLSKVIILADVFENEAQYFRPGMVATVRMPNVTPARGAKVLRATVSKLLPQFDGTTRTMKLRLEVENAEFILRPEMFVDVELPVPVPEGLSIPADALVDSGRRKRVFVDRGNGMFEPREVESGMRVGDQVQILKGLTAGERVAVAGTFLLDSESRLKSTAASAPAAEVMGGKAKLKVVSATQMASARSSGKLEPLPAKATDPKCGMEVRPAESVAEGLTTSHKGKTYYFCSKGCKEEFEANPEKFVATGQASGSHD